MEKNKIGLLLFSTHKKMKKKSFLGIGITSDLLNVIAQPRKAKTNKWNHIKLKRFCT